MSKTSIIRFLYLAILALSIVWVLCAPFNFEYGIFELADGKNKSAELALIKNNSSKIRIVLESKNRKELQIVAQNIAKIFDVKTNNDKINATKALLLEHSNYLLSQENISILESGNAKKICIEAKDKILSPYNTSLFKVSKDPFFLLDNYAKNLIKYAGDWKMSEGFLEKEKDGIFYLALILNTQNFDDTKLKNCLLSVEKQRNEFVNIYISGARVHSLSASEKSKGEINLLSGLSLIIVFLIGYLAFGTIKIFLPMALALGSSFVIALASVMLMFERPHICVLIFATSLIGLSVDYSYHYFSSCKKFSPEVAFENIKSPLNKTLITTLLCFAILYFSNLDLLKEISVFSTVGLISSYLFVRFFYPPLVKILKPNFNKTVFSLPQLKLAKSKRAILAILVLLSVIGIFLANFKTEAKDLYSPHKNLLSQEKAVSEIFADEENVFAIIKASNFEELLATDEKSKLNGISKFIPSLKRQEQNKKLISDLYAKHATSLQKSIGANKKFTMPENQSPLRLEDFKGTNIEDAISSMLYNYEGRWTAIIPIKKDKKTTLETFSPVEFLNSIFDKYMKTTVVLIAISFALLITMFAFVFRHDFFKLILPIILAIALPIFVLSAFNINVNLFHILALFIIMGLGIDYSIFHYSNGSKLTKNAVLISFATSFVGFGALAFTTFGAISSIGIMLAMGLAFAYFISLILASKNE